MTSNSNGVTERTRVHVECPHIIQKLPIDLTTKYKKLGTDYCQGMAITTDWPGTIRHDASPFSRYWSARNLSSAQVCLDQKKKKIHRAEVEQIKRVILGLVYHLLVTEIRAPTPDQKGIVDERGGVSNTRGWNISAGLQEGCGEIAR